MSLEGLGRVPSPQKDPELWWRSVQRARTAVPVVITFVLAVGLLMRPETRRWADVQLNVAIFAVIGVAGQLLGPIYVRATMIAALDAFAKRARTSSEGTVAEAIAPLLVAQIVASALPAVLGFIAYSLGASTIVFLCFVAVAFLSYAYFVPSRPQWEGWLARARPPREQRVERM